MPTSYRRPLIAALTTVAALLAASLALVLAPAAQAADSRDSLVTRCGIRFCLDGKPYYAAGTNTYDMFTDGFDWLPGEQYVDKVKIDAQMQRLQNDGVQVLRLWMFSHEEWQGFEATKGVYTEEEFILFDYIIKSAKDHFIRLIPVFENFWEAYGGIDTRLAWEGLPNGYANRWRFFNKTACPGCFTQYKNYVKYALSRTNFFTGVKWINEPTIFAWELMNEPRYPDATPNENTTGTTLRAWVDEMGAYVKSLDPNHLLGTGQEGQETRYGYGGDSGGPFVYIQQSPYIDFTSGHMYPTEGWAGLDFTKARSLLKAWISDSHNQVGKPFFLGEWNAGTDKTTWWTQMYAEMEASGGDADAFWWFPQSSSCGGFDSGEGCPEHTVFRQHAANFKAKSGTGTTTGPTSASPSRSASASPSRSASASPSVTPSRSASASPSVTPSRSASASPSRSASASPSASNSAGGCTGTYSVTGQWPGGFQAEVVVRNTGTAAITGWTLAWTFPNGQTITQLWAGTYTQTGSAVSVKNMSYNGALAPNATTSVGFLGNWTGANGVPTAVTCTKV